MLALFTNRKRYLFPFSTENTVSGVVDYKEVFGKFIAFI